MKDQEIAFSLANLPRLDLQPGDAVKHPEIIIQIADGCVQEAPFCDANDRWPRVAWNDVRHVVRVELVSQVIGKISRQSPQFPKICRWFS